MVEASGIKPEPDPQDETRVHVVFGLVAGGAGEQDVAGAACSASRKRNEVVSVRCVRVGLVCVRVDALAAIDAAAVEAGDEGFQLHG